MKSKSNTWLKKKMKSPNGTTFYIHLPRLLHYGYVSYTGGIPAHDIRDIILSLHELSGKRLGVSTTICHNESPISTAFERAVEWYSWLKSNNVPTFMFVLDSKTIDKPRQYSDVHHYKPIHTGVNRLGAINDKKQLSIAFDASGFLQSPIANNAVKAVNHFERIEYKTGVYDVLIYGCEAVSAGAEGSYIDFVMQHGVSKHIVRSGVNLTRSRFLNTMSGVWLYDTSDFFSRLNHWLIK